MRESQCSPHAVDRYPWFFVDCLQGGFCSSGQLTLVTQLGEASKNYCNGGCKATCPAGYVIVGGGCACTNYVVISLLVNINSLNLFVNIPANGQPTPITPPARYVADAQYCVCSDKVSTNYAIAECCSTAAGRRRQ